MHCHKICNGKIPRDAIANFTNPLELNTKLLITKTFQSIALYVQAISPTPCPINQEKERNSFHQGFLWSFKFFSESAGPEVCHFRNVNTNMRWITILCNPNDLGVKQRLGCLSKLLGQNTSNVYRWAFSSLKISPVICCLVFCWDDTINMIAPISKMSFYK